MNKELEAAIQTCFTLQDGRQPRKDEVEKLKKELEKHDHENAKSWLDWLKRNHATAA